MKVQFGMIAATILAALVTVQSAVAQGEPTQDQGDMVNKLALTTWIAAGKVLDDRFEHCENAFEKVLGRKYVYTPCFAYLAKEVSEAEFFKNSRKPIVPVWKNKNLDWKEKQAAQEIDADAIALKVENGDRSASELCHRKAADGYGDVGFANICITKVNMAAIKALRAKKFEPTSCEQWGYANIESEVIPSVMRVSLDTKKYLGKFSGEITQINGKTVVIYNSSLSTNAIISIDNKTKMFSQDNISVGLVVDGIGMQTGSQQVHLASGRASSAATIYAKCIEGKSNY